MRIVNSGPRPDGSNGCPKGYVIVGGLSRFAKARRGAPYGVHQRKPARTLPSLKARGGLAQDPGEAATSSRDDAAGKHGRHQRKVICHEKKAPRDGEYYLFGARKGVFGNPQQIRPIIRSERDPSRSQQHLEWDSRSAGLFSPLPPAGRAMARRLKKAREMNEQRKA
ncbi:hypothetical protein ZHAS_00012002 [Anopheles sinensis]|uniref:Uncharacterized protein n=1 Tax=Anopheles sinensis TaxID=74873 RepID=A0A084W1R9_ANOSI|nr:hypothetical protein ZHAS_00012002 [Anopheles sinensis]